MNSDCANDGNAAPLTVGQCATMACLLEVMTPKPGNVHRGADFDDVTLGDFALSAVAIAPAMELAVREGVGRAVLAAIRATRGWVASNTNLGTVLLLAPLAAVPRSQPLAVGVLAVLDRLGEADCRDVYEAIRLARPGGLGVAASMDVSGPPPKDLRDAMRAAAETDLVARQYVDGFHIVLHEALPELIRGCSSGLSLSTAILQTHVRLLSMYPDSLIVRKCGIEVARSASQQAAVVLAAGPPGEAAWHAALSDLDFWLRADQHRRNPGTTADLIAAALFAALRDQTIQPPFFRGS